MRPNYAKTVTVENFTEDDIKCEVSFQDEKEPPEMAEIKAGDKWTSTERLQNKGSWTAVSPVKSVTVQNAKNEKASFDLTEKVDGVVKVFALKVTAHDEGI